MTENMTFCSFVEAEIDNKTFNKSICPKNVIEGKCMICPISEQVTNLGVKPTDLFRNLCP